MTIQSFGGEFQVVSKEGMGTIITMTFVKSIPPKWFVTELILEDNSTIVSLDDDQAIHNLWAERLSAAKGQGHHYDFRNFTSGEELLSENPKAHVYLIDYELLNQKFNGLEVIEKLGVAHQSILVTSRYEEKPIFEKCAQLGIKLIPKNMAAFVPIQFSKAKKKYDVVLLDDDELPQMCWRIKAAELNKSFLGFTSSDGLKQALPEISNESVFYIDSNLGKNIKGENVAKELFEKGYKNLYLTTGYEPSDFTHVTWVKAVIGKEPTFE